MLSNLTGWHFLIVLIIILLVFGAAKLPALAKSMGQSMKIFRNEIKTEGDQVAKAEASAPVVFTEDPPAGSDVHSNADRDHKSTK